MPKPRHWNRLEEILQNDHFLQGGLAELKNIEADLVEFAGFALDYLANLMDSYWQLEHEDQVWCEQMLFPGGIYFNSEQKVHTPEISSIFTLQSQEGNKKEPAFD